MALDDVPVDDGYKCNVTDYILQTGSFSSFRSRDKGRLKRKRYEIKWTRLTSAELATIKAVFDSAGYGGRVLWTPPEESSPMAFHIVNNTYKDYVNLGDRGAEMTLEWMPGVPTS